MRVSPSDKSLIRLRISSHWENMRAGGWWSGGPHAQGAPEQASTYLCLKEKELGGDHGRHLQGQGEGVRARGSVYGGEGRKECV